MNDKGMEALRQEYFSWSLQEKACKAKERGFLYALNQAQIESLLSQARQGHDQARNDLIAGLRPFVHRVCSRRCGRFLSWENDDELGIGLLALNEAIDAYSPDYGGSFMSFAVKVIDRRLIDYLRRQGNHAPIHLSTLEAEAEQLAAPEPEENLDLSLAVEQFTQELAEFKISPADLVKSSPKHRDTRHVLTRVARYLAGNRELLDQFFQYRQLPLAQLCLQTGVSRRVLERGRRYVVALTLIFTRDAYFPLRSFARLDDDDLYTEKR